MTAMGTVESRLLGLEALARRCREIVLRTPAERQTDLTSQELVVRGIRLLTDVVKDDNSTDDEIKIVASRIDAAVKPVTEAKLTIIKFIEDKPPEDYPVI